MNRTTTAAAIAVAALAGVASADVVIENGGSTFLLEDEFLGTLNVVEIGFTTGASDDDLGDLLLDIGTTFTAEDVLADIISNGDGVVGIFVGETDLIDFGGAEAGDLFTSGTITDVFRESDGRIFGSLFVVFEDAPLVFEGTSTAGAGSSVFEGPFLEGVGPVPTPGAVALLGLGGLAALRRRR